MRKKTFLILAFGIFGSACIWAQVAVSLDKMNVLFPGGVDNMLTVVVSDLPDSSLLLIPSMGEIQRTSEGKYTWKICHRDTNTATLSIRNMLRDTLIKVFNYRVNAIPVPVPFLFKPKTFHDNPPLTQSRGISMMIENFNFDTPCSILYFDAQYIPKNQDGYVKRNEGARFNSEVTDMIRKAKPGDEYHFFHITYRCGCDPMPRHLSDVLIYKVP